jgi:hypothetical protein
MAGPETIDFEAMYAAFKRVKISIGLTVDEVRLSGKAAHIVREPFSIKLEEPATIEADILQEDVQAFLSHVAPGGLQNFRVKMDEGKVFVEATMQIIVNVPVSAVCTLRIDARKRLFIDLESLSVMGSGPKSLVQKQLDAINPVFDLDTVPVSGVLESVEIRGGKALLKGHLEPDMSASSKA